MSVTVEALRRHGTRHVVLDTTHGALAGYIVQAALSDAAVVVMFATDAQPSQPLVVLLDDIRGIAER